MEAMKPMKEEKSKEPAEKLSEILTNEKNIFDELEKLWDNNHPIGPKTLDLMEKYNNAKEKLMEYRKLEESKPKTLAEREENYQKLNSMKKELDEIYGVFKAKLGLFKYNAMKYFEERQKTSPSKTGSVTVSYRADNEIFRRFVTSY